MADNTAHTLELVAIEKSFGGVHALRGADLSARPGEIVGLCGENGAGKSTLLKILSGVYPHSSYRGEVRVHGNPVRFATTKDAQRAGIAIVHQELMLVPELSVAANLMLGREGSASWAARLGLVDDDVLEAETRALLERFGVAADIDPAAAVSTLGIGLQQVIEIVRALSVIGDRSADANAGKAKVLVLDEPTAALTGRETARLMHWLRQLRDEGTTCIYVSHRMDEIFSLCDRVTVLRDGKTVGTVDAKTTPPEEVVALMVGRSLVTTGRRETCSAKRDAGGGPPAIELREVSVPLGRARIEEEGARNCAIERLSLSVARGEVVAICGAMGAGRTALLSTLFGSARHGFIGEIRVAGTVRTLRAPADAIAAGIAFVPEDRKGQGLVLGMTVTENLMMPTDRARAGVGVFEWLSLVDDDGEEAIAARRIDDLKIRGSADAAVGTLSGGNQQKVVLGKWLSDAREGDANVLLLDEPTRGVDVGAREEIYAIVERLTERGTSVLFASSDVPEVIRLADRIIVLRHGRLVGELSGATATEEQIVALATGAIGSQPCTP